MKKISFKAGAIAILFALLVIGVCGCMNKRNSELSVKNCQKHLEEKYGEKFTFVSVSDDDSVKLTSTGLLFRPESHPDVKVLIEASLDENDKGVYFDNYPAFLYEEQTKELFESIANEIYGEKCRVLYEANDSKVCSGDGECQTFEDYISDEYHGIEFAVLLEPGYDTMDKDVKLKKIYDIFCEKKVVCCCDVYYTTDEEKYTNCNMNSMDLLESEKWCEEHGQLMLKNDFSVRYHCWMGTEGWENYEDWKV